MPACEENLAFYNSIDDSISDGESVGDVTNAGSLAYSVEYSCKEKAADSGQAFDVSSRTQGAPVEDDKIFQESENDDGNRSDSTAEERTQL